MSIAKDVRAKGVAMSRLRWVALIALVVVALGAMGCSSGSAPDPAKLQGTWKLKAFGAVDSTRDANPKVTTEITFAASGEATGTGGVNLFGTAYKTSGGDALEFAPIRTTNVAGEPAAMQQESEFLKALELTRHFEFNEGNLVLSSKGNDTLLILEPK